MDAQISLRVPTASKLPQPDFTPPTTDWLAGTWHVTHSTLPMWKSKRNVTITYKPLDPPHTDSTNAPEPPARLDDIVSYQTLTSDKVKTVHGIDTASGGKDSGAWDWRGKGWLMIASSHWEVLGYGISKVGEGGEAGNNEWAVTYFAKTMFTPAGIDVYSRKKEGAAGEIVEAIKKALGNTEDEGVKKLAGEIFEVKRD